LPVSIKNFFAAFGDLGTPTGRARIAQQTRAAARRVADDTTRALSGGLGLADVRALLRGDPPVEKPNIREQVLGRVFWTHLRPRAYYKSSTKFSHTFGLGFFSVLFAFVQLITGTLMMFVYEPTPERAYQSTLALITQIPFGQFIRDLHYLSANLLIVVVFLHLLRVYLTGAFKQPRRFTWVIGVLLFTLTLAIAFIGYRLPMDRAVAWGNPTDLLRYYLLHTGILPGVGLLLVGAHYFRVSRLHGISLPATEEEAPNEAVRERARVRVNYLPDLWARELLWMAIALCATFALAAFVVHAPLAAPADPTHAASAPLWFLLWWQGLLRDPVVLPILMWLHEALWIDLAQFYNGAVWQGLIVPLLLGLLLLGVPYLDALWDKFWGRAPSRLGKNRKLGIALGLLALGLLVLFSFIGAAQLPSSPANAIAQEFLPDDSGEVRRIGYADLPPGTYELAKYAAPSAERFENLLSKIQIRVQQADWADAKGSVIVEEWQTNLKKITLRMTWTPTAPGESGVFERSIFLHRDSMYSEW
jgi:quinol-cytochrome oxidoreductase complex cytochrome b subunit